MGVPRAIHGPTWVEVVSRSIHFLPKKRHFWSRNVNYPRFFGHFLTLGTSLAEPGLLKTGLKLNLVVGGSLQVIESTSFSSKTGPQEPPRTPGDLPGDPQEGLEIICIFFDFFGGPKVGSLQPTRRHPLPLRGLTT